MAVKRVVIAGCRTFNDYDVAKPFIDNCISNIRKDNTIIIVSGGCRGADKIGEKYAKENHFELELFLPDWAKYGRSAGPKRNKQMAEASDYIICFWDGRSRGTKSMIDFAKMYSRPLRVKKYKRLFHPKVVKGFREIGSLLLRFLLCSCVVA